MMSNPNTNSRQKLPDSLVLPDTTEPLIASKPMLGISTSTPSSPLLTITDEDVLPSASSAPNLHSFDYFTSPVSSPLASPATARRKHQLSVNQNLFHKHTDSPPATRTRHLSLDYTSSIEGSSSELSNATYLPSGRRLSFSNKPYYPSAATHLKTRIQATLDALATTTNLPRTAQDTEELTQNVLALHSHFSTQKTESSLINVLKSPHPLLYRLLDAHFNKLSEYNLANHNPQSSDALEDKMRIFSYLSEQKLDSLSFQDLIRICLSSDGLKFNKIMILLNIIEAFIALTLKKNKNLIVNAYAWPDQPLFKTLWSVLQRTTLQSLSSVILLLAAPLYWLLYPLQVYRTFRQLKIDQQLEFEKTKETLNARRRSLTELGLINAAPSPEHVTAINSQSLKNWRYILLAIVQEFTEHVWYVFGLMSHIESHLTSPFALIVYAVHDLLLYAADMLWWMHSPQHLTAFHRHPAENNNCILTHWWAKNVTTDAAIKHSIHLSCHFENLLIFRQNTIPSIHTRNLGFMHFMHPFYIVSKAYLSTLMILAATGTLTLLHSPFRLWEHRPKTNFYSDSFRKVCQVTSFPVLLSLRFASLSLYMAAVLLKESVMTVFKIKEFLKMLLLIDCRTLLLFVSSEISSTLVNQPRQSARTSPFDWRYS